VLRQANAPERWFVIASEAYSGSLDTIDVPPDAPLRVCYFDRKRFAIFTAEQLHARNTASEE
jgi:hypothetical protein